MFHCIGGPQITSHQYGTALPVNVNPGSADSFELMRSWIQKCRLEHKCGIDEHCPSLMPRLHLKINTGNESRSIKLIHVAAGQKHKYIALSYCWGGDQKKLLTSANLPGFCRDGIEVEQLDVTIQDAIRVTKELGYLYLWVDALCIIQDDAKAKAIEIERMGDIYKNALFTIVAARASRVSEGFLSPRQPAGASNPDFVFQVAYGDSNWLQQRNADQWVVLIPEEEGVHWKAPREPWEARAWTLQEDLLSGRQLRFGKMQTTWVCHCHHETYEDRDGWFAADLETARSHLDEERQLGELARMLRQPGSINSAEEARGRWYDLIQVYSRRSLTIPQDRLPAVSAISRRLASIFQDEYWCGLWKSEAPWELLWHAREPILSFADERNHEDRENEPSWSWVAVSQEIGVVFEWERERRGFKIDDDFEILSHSAQYISAEDPYGAVTAGQLKVRGLVRPAPFALQQCYSTVGGGGPTWTLNPDTPRSSEEDSGRTTWSLRRIFHQEGLVYLDRPLSVLLADPNVDNGRIVLLVVGYNVSPPHGGTISGPTGLILLDRGDNRFSRLGIFDISPVYQGSEDYYGGEFLTEEEHIRLFKGLWGGQRCIKEISLI